MQSEGRDGQAALHTGQSLKSERNSTFPNLKFLESNRAAGIFYPFRGAKEDNDL